MYLTRLVCVDTIVDTWRVVFVARVVVGLSEELDVDLSIHILEQVEECAIGDVAGMIADGSDGRLTVSDESSEFGTQHDHLLDAVVVELGECGALLVYVGDPLGVAALEEADRLVDGVHSVRLAASFATNALLGAIDAEVDLDRVLAVLVAVYHRTPVLKQYVAAADQVEVSTLGPCSSRLPKARGEK